MDIQEHIKELKTEYENVLNTFNNATDYAIIDDAIKMMNNLQSQIRLALEYSRMRN